MSHTGIIEGKARDVERDILNDMNGQNREDIHPGLEVDIVLKADQRTDKLTRGIVQDILTSSSFHPHGIKVRLESGEVGRVQYVVE
jgi:uncharacterized repeat protein (TIGR03833 family)